ncbi:MAG: UDP-N-acetylglucosamine 1-carboxyvinyltransferase [Alistipes onderdonkii]|nr:UDP-N-acetylglucosamine 1-carboxyvinyltransferase [Alistipes onderdonkii]
MSKAVKPEAPQKVDYNDAVAESKKYFDGDDLAATVWVSKYALKDSFGNIYETSPRQMHERIAAEIERIERKYPNPMSREEVFGLLDHFRYVIPQGGPMTGIGNNFQVASLSNCFVIGHKHPADSYGGIFRMDEEQVQLMKRRGGVGHDLSHIRPTGSPVLNSALTSTGIVPFMERYSNSTREVAQDGRRGALMLSLSIKHPDAERFIDAKVDTGKVTGANVSIKIDDEFMRAAIAGKKYHQQFPINSDNPRYEQDIDARKLWDKIIHNAWKSAEPGVLFWDTIIRESVPDCYADEGFVTVSTNPCGEIPLCPYDSCRLLALNLLSYVDNPFKKGAKFNFDIADEFFMVEGRELKGTYMLLDEASVTGTANIVMAAVMAKGFTTIYNAACEPYLQQLCKMLNRMGARISGIASNLLTIEGVESLGGTEHTLLPDMIEVGSFIGMAAMNQSELTIRNVSFENLGIIPAQFARMGIRFEQHDDDIYIPQQEHYSIDTFLDGSIMTIADAPWPGLTPDLLSIFLVVATQAKGAVLIHQKMFESRLFFVDKLIDMGAQIILCDPHRATVIGHDHRIRLRATRMTSPDIRAGVALLIAAMSAEGVSTIQNIDQIDRGYKDIDGRLNALGARITRIDDCE